MLKYLKKFVLDILPSVVATIVGAYIVHHYVIPAATPNTTAAAAVSSADSVPDAAGAEKPSFLKGVADKVAIEKIVEKTSDAAPADVKKRNLTHRAKPSARTPDQTASISEFPAAEERRDANDLARAAIERLRTPADAPRAVPAMPALPPAITVATPSSEVFNAGTGAIMTPARPALSARAADPTRPMPPETIPAPPPLELHSNIVTATAGRAVTAADDMMSAAKSVLHAVLPR